MTSQRIQLDDLIGDVKVYEPHLMRTPITPSELIPETDLVHAAAKTAQDLLKRQGLADIEITDDDIQKTNELFQNHIAQGLPLTPSKIQKSAIALKLEAYVTDYDHQVIQHAEQIRLLVTNKLLELSDHKDARVQLKAVELLGKIADVGMFIEKQEITYKQKSYEELEAQLKQKLGLLIEGEVVGDTIVEPNKLSEALTYTDATPLPSIPSVTKDTLKFLMNE